MYKHYEYITLLPGSTSVFCAAIHQILFCQNVLRKNSSKFSFIMIKIYGIQVAIRIYVATSI